MKKKIIIIIIASVAMVLYVSLSVFMSFCRFDDILIYGLGRRPYDTNAKLIRAKEIIHESPNFIWLRKGASFNNITFHKKGDDRKILLSIKFNWDNTISIKGKRINHNVEIDRVVTGTIVRKIIDEETWIEFSDDSIYSGIDLDNVKTKETVRVFRQKSSMPYGGKRVGFELKICGEEYLTGHDSPFDY